MTPRRAGRIGLPIAAGLVPTGGLTAPDGALWLLENSPTNRVRVRRVAADGRETIY